MDRDPMPPVVLAAFESARAAEPPTRVIRSACVEGGLLFPPGPGTGRIQGAVRREDWRVERRPGATDTDRTTIGGTCFISGHARKVQADYTVKREEPELANDEFRLSLLMVV